MAAVRRRNNGAWSAYWRDRNGKQVEESTGFYQFEKALRAANRMEAEAKFWEDHAEGLWVAYARMNFSPRFLWESFTNAKHCRFDRFRELLVEAGVEFAPRSKWRDRAVASPARAKRFLYRGKRLTVSQMIEAAGSTVAACTVAYRLKRGWKIDEALRTPPMTKAESGRLGADKVNGRPG